MDQLYDVPSELGAVKAMIDLRKQMTNINVQKNLETHLELQNANMFENFEDEFEEPDHLKNNENTEKENLDKDNEVAQEKEITSESMEKVPTRAH